MDDAGLFCNLLQHVIMLGYENVWRRDANFATVCKHSSHCPQIDRFYCNNCYLVWFSYIFQLKIQYNTDTLICSVP